MSEHNCTMLHIKFNFLTQASSILNTVFECHNVLPSEVFRSALDFRRDRIWSRGWDPCSTPGGRILRCPWRKAPASHPRGSWWRYRRHCTSPTLVSRSRSSRTNSAGWGRGSLWKMFVPYKENKNTKGCAILYITHHTISQLLILFRGQIQGPVSQRVAINRTMDIHRSSICD